MHGQIVARAGPQITVVENINLPELGPMAPRLLVDENRNGGGDKMMKMKKEKKKENGKGREREREKKTVSVDSERFDVGDADEMESDDEAVLGGDEWEDMVEEAGIPESDIKNMVFELKEIGLHAFVQKYVDGSLTTLRKVLLCFGVNPQGSNDRHKLVSSLMYASSRVLRHRNRSLEYSTVQDVADLIKKSKKILVLAGAGVSTSCGVPDFRSPDGLYAMLKKTHPELTDPQEMFDLNLFKEEPSLFYSFAKDIAFAEDFEPSPCHHFVKLLQDRNKLLRLWNQNVECLFQKAGVTQILNCHGSFETASCISCKKTVEWSSLREDIVACRVPKCAACVDKALQARSRKRKKRPMNPAKWKPNHKAFDDDADDDLDDVEEEVDVKEATMKPGILFFGEKVCPAFDEYLIKDRTKVDLVLVIGTSLSVAPVSHLPGHLPHRVPLVLINREPISHLSPDVSLIGDCDTIISHLCSRLKWELPPRQHQRPIPQLNGDTPVTNPSTTVTTCDAASGSSTPTTLASASPVATSVPPASSDSSGYSLLRPSSSPISSFQPSSNARPQQNRSSSSASSSLAAMDLDAKSPSPAEDLVSQLGSGPPVANGGGDDKKRGRKIIKKSCGSQFPPIERAPGELGVWMFPGADRTKTLTWIQKFEEDDSESESDDDDEDSRVIEKPLGSPPKRGRKRKPPVVEASPSKKQKLHSVISGRKGMARGKSPPAKEGSIVTTGNPPAQQLPPPPPMGNGNSGPPNLPTTQQKLHPNVATPSQPTPVIIQPKKRKTWNSGSTGLI